MTVTLMNDGPITLSKVERLILANQYAIMALIDERNARDYEKSQEAVTSGCAAAIEDMFSWIFDGLPDAECSLVIRAMAMYDALQRSYKDLGKDNAGIKKHAVSFPGFDGNSDIEYMAYARYVRDYEKRFDYLDTEDNCNSRRRMIARYRSVLPVWENELDGVYQLTAEQMERLLRVR